MSGQALAAAAEALIGRRFRLHGRDPASGLDCIGVLAAALARIGRPAPLPNGYAMRIASAVRFADAAERCGLVPAALPFMPGDVTVFHVGPNQFHLAIAARCGGFIHAHAGLRRVVLTAPSAEWRVAGHWRLPA